MISIDPPSVAIIGAMFLEACDAVDRSRKARGIGDDDLTGIAEELRTEFVAIGVDADCFTIVSVKSVPPGMGVDDSLWIAKLRFNKQPDDIVDMMAKKSSLACSIAIEYARKLYNAVTCGEEN